MKTSFRFSLFCLFFFLLITSAASTGSATSKPGREKWCAQQIFSKTDSRIEESLKSMTLSEKVGEMLIAQIEGHYNSSADKEYQLLSRLVLEGKVGGVSPAQPSSPLSIPQPSIRDCPQTSRSLISLLPSRSAIPSGRQGTPTVRPAE